MCAVVIVVTTLVSVPYFPFITWWL